ncbi:N(6)-adenosine-methyltransferase catalytic subunit METTL3-like [Ptychodera flava]|uniref:N(6)-adenosine-methyltransferase catalytic subunit METTL3-like n=1 Tax=Ptychodera flava TaxID=63121 RepID=UPI00396A41BE
MSDTWSDIVALKKKQDSLRERMQRRKRERQGLGVCLATDDNPAQTHSGPPSRSNSPVPTFSTSDLVKIDPEVEKRLLEVLCDHALMLPTDSPSLQMTVSKALNKEVTQASVEEILRKFSAQELIEIKDGGTPDGQACVIVTSAEDSKLTAVSNQLNEKDKPSGSRKRKREHDSPTKDEASVKLVARHPSVDADPDSIESLLSMPSIKEQETKKMGEEIFDLLSKPTAKEQSVVEKFKSQGNQLKEFCPHGTKEECMKLNNIDTPCDKLHFRRIINQHTDESLGDCSFLNTCFHMDTCKYVHYEIDSQRTGPTQPSRTDQTERGMGSEDKKVILYPPQWIQCDLRSLNMQVLGKFAVIMADPPWDIHMELPYGTMQDDEMRRLDVPSLQDDGFIFLWVTGRAMELGRECLKLWGYRRCDELIWVKTNQLQRLIRTGRTGHWLNHGKEHCLVGVKGNPKNYNRGLDCDVIVAEVRETSHKPDEIYGLIERLSPGTRKIELFGRPHNVQPNWITLGNQLDGVHLLDPEVVERFKKNYPDGNIMKPINKPS